MAFNWQKLFENWTWHNRTQSKDTPINATNLNKINNAIDGIDNRVVAVGEALDELVFEDVTVSGNPAVFESRSEQLSKQTTVNIEPIQDLHGYDKPWSGGTGKNKAKPVPDTTVAGVTYTNLSDGGLHVSGTSSYSFSQSEFVLKAGSYILSKGKNDDGGKIQVHIRNASTDAIIASVINLTETPFTLSADTNVRHRVVVRDNNSVDNDIYPMVRLATESDATFAPYTNICPISGLDSVVVERCGKNKVNFSNISVEAGVDKQKEIGSITLPAGTYTLSYTLNTNVTATRNRPAYVIGSSYPAYGDDIITAGRGSWTFTIEKESTLTFKWWMHTVSKVCTISDFQLELGSTATEYEPYRSTTYTTTLPTTVYGGTLDLTNGRLVVDRAYIASYNGETLPGAWISDRDVYTGSNSPTTGAQVVYELTTPVITTITPSTLSLLKGLNVVSTNGDTVEVTFNDPVSHDDLDGKLDKTDVATVEGDKASRAYSVNEFMLRSDGFYRVTAPIASGASITSSNTTKTTIGAVLTALLNS